MNSNFIGRAQICVALLLSCIFLGAAEPTPSDWRTVNVLHTNQSTRVITNVIEVRVPNNVFVNEYHTNWFQRTVTNVVDVAVTNWSKKTLTNTVVMNAFQTN